MTVHLLVVTHYRWRKVEIKGYILYEMAGELQKEENFVRNFGRTNCRSPSTVVSEEERWGSMSRGKRNGLVMPHCSTSTMITSYLVTILSKLLAW